MVFAYIYKFMLSKCKNINIKERIFHTIDYC